MLVLSRRKNERLVVRIGNEVVTICICDIIGTKKVRIGVEASTRVQIAREEVYLAKQQERDGGK